MKCSTCKTENYCVDEDGNYNEWAAKQTIQIVPPTKRSCCYSFTLGISYEEWRDLPVGRGVIDRPIRNGLTIVDSLTGKLPECLAVSV